MQNAEHSSKMRLLFLGWSISSKRGGMERSMFEQCVAMRARGHDVTLGFHEDGDFHHRYLEAGVRLLRLDHYSPRPGHPIEGARTQFANLCRTIALPLDLVIANDPQSTFFAAVLARMKRIPLACNLRLSPPDAARRSVRFGLRYVSRFIAVSHSNRDAWVERGLVEDAVSVVHNGLDTRRYSPPSDFASVRRRLGLETDDFVIVAAGRIVPDKNYDCVLHTFAAVRRSEPRARLLIAGAAHSETEVEYLKHLRALSASLGVANAVRWMGPRSDMPVIFGGADVAVLFTKVPETFGRVTAEALACGCPVVTPRRGGSVEILTGEFARLMFDPDRPGDAVRVIRSLVGWRTHDPDFAGRAHGHIAGNFSVARMEDTLEQTLRLSIREGPVRRGASLVPLPASTSPAFDEAAEGAEALSVS